MLHKGNKEIIAFGIGSKAVTALYKGAHLVWQAVRSCFGAGGWQNDKPWMNDEGWRNG